jgi:hypothetical protein
MFYLRNIDQYTTALEEEIATLYTTARDYNPTTISSLQTEITKRDTIISY